jgi:hypothetical protein
MKILKLLIAAIGLTLASCASIPPPNPDDTLVYMIIDSKEMRGSFNWAAFSSADKSKTSGVVWRYAPEDQKRYVVAWVTLAKAKSFYLSELQSMDTGFFASGARERYVIPMQASPLRVEKSSGPSSIKYLGALKVHYVRTPIFQNNQFGLEKCVDCPGEKVALEAMQNIMKKYPKEGLSVFNNYKQLIDARVKAL